MINKLFKNKDVKVIILEVFLIALGLVGLTLGVKYIMNSINVNVDTSKLAIDSMNANVTNGTLTPINDGTVNINTTSNVLRITFDVKGASTNTGNNIIYDAILNIDADCSLKNENIKWNLYKNNNLLTSGNLSPKYDKDVFSNKLVLTDTQQDLVPYSGTADKYVFILWMSESCNEEDITKCDISNALTSDSGGKSISGNIDIRLNSGKKKENKRESSNIENTCSILGGNAAEAVKLADDGTTDDDGSGVYKIEHSAIASDSSATGSEIPAVTDYRYYGPNPNNYILLPDMNTNENILSCYYNGEEVYFEKKCSKIYKVDYSSNNYDIIDEYFVEDYIEAGPSSTSWDSVNNKCLYNGKELTSTYEGEVTEKICNQFSVWSNRYWLITELGEGTPKYSTSGLYRIIGSIYEEKENTNRIKVIKATPLTDGTTKGFSWDYKVSSGRGSYSNVWATVTSENYSDSLTSGSTLMQLLNSGLWWNGTSGSYCNGSTTATTVNFTNYKLSNKAKSYISTSRYYLGGYNNTSVLTATMYEYERGTARYDTNRPLYWDGIVGLMYPSDYGYAAGNSCAMGTNLRSYSEGCYQKNWLHNSNYQWLMSPQSSSPNISFFINRYGFVQGDIGGDFDSVPTSNSVRPVFFLNPNATISKGTGTIDDPYILASD